VELASGKVQMNTQDGVQFDNIPESLKEIPSWLVWGDNKVPYNARTGKQTGVTWNGAASDFDIAQKAYESGLYRGVGFIISNPIVAIDLDHCVTYSPIDNRPYPDEFADGIVTDLYSYTELSPSGTGLHILMRGNIPGNRQTKRVEMYSRDKYITMTGHVLGDAYRTVVDDNGELSRLYQRISRTVAPSISAIPTRRQGNGYPPRTDEQVIQAIQTRGNPKFKALWNGAWADLFKSQSEADVALVRYLWHFSNEHDPQQVDRLFRRSGLFTIRPGKSAEKWDEYRESAGMSYGWWTIAKVVGVDNANSGN